jgi:hypothetical protein
MIWRYADWTVDASVSEKQVFFFSGLKMEAVYFPETLASIDEYTWRQIPEDKQHLKQFLNFFFAVIAQ